MRHNYVKIPKDLTQIKSKFWGLTVKQFLFVVPGIVVGVWLYVATFPFLGPGFATFTLVLGGLPFGVCAFCNKDGLSAWQWLRLYRHHTKRPTRRFYKNDNFFHPLKNDPVTRKETREGTQKKASKPKQASQPKPQK